MSVSPPAGNPVIFAAPFTASTPLAWGTNFAWVAGSLWVVGLTACLFIYKRSYELLAQRRRSRQTSLASLMNDDATGSSPTSPSSPIELDEDSARSLRVPYTTITYSPDGHPVAAKDVAAAAPSPVARQRSNSINSDHFLLDSHRVKLEAAEQVRQSTTRGGVSHAELFGSAAPPPPPRTSTAAGRPEMRTVAKEFSRNYFDDNDHLVPRPPPRPVPVSQRVPADSDPLAGLLGAHAVQQSSPDSAPTVAAARDMPRASSSLRMGGRVFAAAPAAAAEEASPHRDNSIAGNYGGVKIRRVENDGLGL